MEYGLVALWLVTYLALAALAAPVVAALLPRFPDRGVGFALPVALAVLGVVGYWVGQFTFAPVSVAGVSVHPPLVASVLVLAALSGIAVWRGVTVDRRRYAEAMTVFTVGFFFLVAVRALDPAVHAGGGEKFLDFGMLNAILRAEVLPPEDFWYAGEPVRYYYGGHMISAMLVRLTGTAPRYAYNLALAGFYGMLVTAAYTLAGAVASGHGRSRVSAGVLAAFFVGVASNLVTAVRFVAWALPGGDTLGRALGIELRGLADGPQHFGYWTASRVLDGTINEFPLFSFLNGDLHAHMMSMPFMLLVAASLYGYWQTPAHSLLRRRLVAFVVLPLLGGLIAVVNTWSFPSVVGLAWLGILFAPADPRDLLPLTTVRAPTGAPSTPRADGGQSDGQIGDGDGNGSARTADSPGDPSLNLVDELLRTGTALVLAAVVGVLAVLFVLPFFTSATSGRSIGFFPERAGLWALLVVHGGFLAVTAWYLAARADPGGRERLRLLGLVAVTGLLVWAYGFLALFPFVLVLAMAWILLRFDHDVGFEAALVVGAIGLIVLVEFAFVEGAGERYNTVFKTYTQVWILWAVAAGVMAAAWANPAGWVGGLRRGSGVLGRLQVPSVGGVLVALLVVSTSIYGGLAMADHVEHSPGPASLDALRFVQTDHSTEAEAIEFVSNLEGTPTIAAAPTRCMYSWSNDYDIRTWRQAGSKVYNPDGGCLNLIVGGSAPASLTGVPTLAGWYHEIGYRGRETFLERVDVVRELYNGTAERQAQIIREYDVEYIYVGPAERGRYYNHSFGERLTGVSVAFAGENVTIYRVDHDELGVRPDSARTVSGGLDQQSAGGSTGVGDIDLRDPGRLAERSTLVARGR